MLHELAHHHQDCIHIKLCQLLCDYDIEMSEKFTMDTRNSSMCRKGTNVNHTLTKTVYSVYVYERQNYCTEGKGGGAIRWLSK